MSCFTRNTSSPQEIAEAGEIFLLALYGHSKFHSLNKCRHILYKRIVAKTPVNGNIRFASLPPTFEASKQHFYRVYLQVQDWMGNSLPPQQWGWKLHEGILVPVESDLPPAPQRLMNIVSCGCKSGCGHSCGCRKAGMVCSEICVECAGVSCGNSPIVEEVVMDTELEN